MKNSQTTTKTKIDVYDPAMCCNTGVCGPDVDDALVNFANNVKWLKAQGMEVQRYNLGQEPEAFKMSVPIVTRLKKEGTDCLPIVVVNGEVVSEGAYPSRQQMSELLGMDGQPKDPSEEKSYLLTALQKAAENGDEEAMRHHFKNGEQEAIDIQNLVKAIQKGIDGRQLTTQKMVQTANDLLGITSNDCGSSPGGGCC